MEILPLASIGEVVPGTDLADLLRNALTQESITAEAGDVLVVTQKIVSKAEDRFVELADLVPSAAAEKLAKTVLKDPRLVELILRESEAVIRAAPNVLIVRHRLGMVMANAGIDRSNIGGRSDDTVLLLPVDPDGTAAALSSAMGCAVVISDSFGRPWRLGVTAVGIGAAGLPALLDRRGEIDRDGRLLEVTQVAVADLLASAAALVTGEGNESIPVVLVRGFRFEPQHIPAAALTRPLTEDLFQ